MQTLVGFHSVQFALTFALSLSVVLSKTFLWVCTLPEFDVCVVWISVALVGRVRTHWWPLEQGRWSLHIRKTF